MNSVPAIKIRPAKRWPMPNLKELWHFRDLLTMFAVRDIKLRYRQTLLGVFWVILQPLMAAGIFSVVFGKIAKLPSQELPYFLFSYAGLLAWNAFSNTFTKSSNCLLQNSHLVSKVFFPRLTLPLSSVYPTTLDFLVALTVLGFLMFIYGVAPTAQILLLPLWFLLVVMLGLGISFFTAALMVSYRDVQHILPVLIQFLLFASPVAYSLTAVPDNLRIFYFLNPLTGLLEAFRGCIFSTHPMSYGAVVYAVISTVVIFVIGIFYFKRMEQKFADVI